MPVQPRRQQHARRKPRRIEPLESRQLLSAVPAEPTVAWQPLDKGDVIAEAVGGQLAELHRASEAGGGAAALHGASRSLLQVRQEQGGAVAVEAVAAESSEQLQQDLEALGLTEATRFGRYVSGWMPVSAIDDMAALPSLQFARPAYRPVSNVGATTSQADIAVRADIGRAVMGVDGSGQMVGVLSDSFDNPSGTTTTNASQDVFSGDLPGFGNPNGFNNSVLVLDDSRAGIDEGRAMLQLVHDLAPGADLAFHTAGISQATFASGIIDLEQAGATVIVDDIIFFAEPMFQDGVVAQAADQVAAAGVPFFSSSGNQGRRSYESGFRSSGFLDPNGGLLHDFDPGPAVDTLQSVTINQGESITLSFQWDQPFFSVSGGMGTRSDVDILLVDATGNFVVASSIDNNLGGDAVEILRFTNDGSFLSNQFNIAISLFAGPQPGRMKWVDFGSNAGLLNEYATFSPASYGHANAAGAESVGAAFYQQTPEFGTNPPQAETSSSAGGVPILFDQAGNSIFDLRPKPEIVAPDGTNTTFFQSDVDGDGFPNFFGTSAAAPHAAAVAALLLQANPALSPAGVYSALEQTAIDMDDPATFGFDVGFDSGTGYGLIQADAALAAVGNTGSGGDFDSDGDVDGDDFLIWQANFPTTNGASHSQGDADGDGDVDGDDFLAWQASFGTAAGTAGAAATPTDRRSLPAAREDGAKTRDDGGRVPSRRELRFRTAIDDAFADLSISTALFRNGVKR